MATLNFLTGNDGKLSEAQNLLGPLGYDVQQFQIDGEMPTIIEPQSGSLNTVALAKIAQGVELLASTNRLQELLLVEDSGLFIDALPDFPGVYSAHVLKSLGCEGILKLLDDNRDAHFMTVVALWTGEAVEVFVGKCNGRISTECRGEGGFGYDPIFIPNHDDSARTFSELSSEEKSTISHRGRALRALYGYLEGTEPTVGIPKTDP
ncbi:MAG: RdgB/HAM1 family non-canonical purine NTP pyrophosphatase [Candidatus Thermoplasmatota archaeon]|nr:RdgB/HAM1 family non-canonical purine NTP pyrophosphatase [Candidatus Thermoplasmatota archaeon]